METPAVAHASLAERTARGRAARAATSRSSHSALDVDLPRDPVGLLEAQDASRVPELVPIRYGRMLASPLAFFRGAAAVMAHDLARMPSSGLRVQLSGDAHLLNFGGYASPDRELVFDLNDFDETLPGPFEWDVKRLAASLAIAGRERGFAPPDRRRGVLGAVRAYRTAIRRFATIGDLDVWYARLDARSVGDVLQVGRDRKLEKALDESVARARRNDGLHALSKLTVLVAGERRIVSRPPLIVPLAELADDGTDSLVRAIFRSYRHSLPADRRVLLERYRYVDAAHKVVGIGSVGTRCWVVLLLGRDEHDPLLLQMKEAGASVLEPFLGASGFANHGQRVVEGERLMQAASDIFLGWVRTEEDLDGASRNFYLRQLRDWKVSVDVQTIEPGGLASYAAACGWTLARAHARSGDPVAIASYLGGSDKFDRAVAEFAASYADRNEDDHRALAAAVSNGRVAADEHT